MKFLTPLLTIFCLSMGFSSKTLAKNSKTQLSQDLSLSCAGVDPKTQTGFVLNATLSPKNILIDAYYDIFNMAQKTLEDQSDETSMSFKSIESPTFKDYKKAIFYQNYSQHIIQSESAKISFFLLKYAKLKELSQLPEDRPFKSSAELEFKYGESKASLRLICLSSSDK